MIFFSFLFFKHTKDIKPQTRPSLDPADPVISALPFKIPIIHHPIPIQRPIYDDIPIEEPLENGIWDWLFGKPGQKPFTENGAEQWGILKDPVPPMAHPFSGIDTGGVIPGIIGRPPGRYVNDYDDNGFWDWFFGSPEKKPFTENAIWKEPMQDVLGTSSFKNHNFLYSLGIGTVGSSMGIRRPSSKWFANWFPRPSTTDIYYSTKRPQSQRLVNAPMIFQGKIVGGRRPGSFVEDNGSFDWLFDKKEYSGPLQSEIYYGPGSRPQVSYVDNGINSAFLHLGGTVGAIQGAKKTISGWFENDYDNGFWGWFGFGSSEKKPFTENAFWKSTIDDKVVSGKDGVFQKAF